MSTFWGGNPITGQNSSAKKFKQIHLSCCVMHCMTCLLNILHTTYAPDYIGTLFIRGVKHKVRGAEPSCQRVQSSQLDDFAKCEKTCRKSQSKILNKMLCVHWEVAVLISVTGPMLDTLIDPTCLHTVYVTQNSQTEGKGRIWRCCYLQVIMQWSGLLEIKLGLMWPMNLDKFDT